MRILIPSDNTKGLDSKISKQINFCPTLTIITLKNKQIKKTEIIINPFRTTKINFKYILKKIKVDILIISEIGKKLLSILLSLKIKIFFNINNYNSRQIISLINKNKFKRLPHIK